jgi:hypothetical protein
MSRVPMRSGRLMRRETGSFLILPLLLAACAGSTAEQDAGFGKHMARARAVLATKTDPDSLAAAALMSVGGHTEESLDLMRRAVAAAPDRRDLAWLNLQFCLKWARCDPEPPEIRLRELDPENGAAWLGALARADSLGDESSKAAALAAIGRSPRVDIYYTTLIARLSDAAAHSGAITVGQAEVEVIGLLAALPLPAYTVASQSCKGERLDHPGTLEICRGVAQAFQGGDTYVTEMVGVAIAKRVWPEQSPEWKSASEARRVFEYRGQLLDKISLGPDDEQSATNYLALCARYHREQDVFRARLVAAGEDPDPPRR